MKTDLTRLIKSTLYAWNGLKQSFRTEQNFRIEIFLSILIIILGFVFHINLLEWIWVLISAFSVMSAELLNTAVERLTDLIIERRRNNLARQAKDIAAAGVLLMVAQALIAGSVVFVPKILKSFALMSQYFPQ